MQAYAFGLGVGTQNRRGEWLEVFYPQPILAPASSLTAPLEARGGSVAQATR